MTTIPEALAALPQSVEGIVGFLMVRGITGYRNEATLCPIASYLYEVTGHRVTVALDVVWPQYGGHAIPLPFHAVRFIGRFDAGDIPELERRSVMT